jgi:hypothetical protein
MYNRYKINGLLYNVRTESHTGVLEDRTQEILQMDGLLKVL